MARPSPIDGLYDAVERHVTRHLGRSFRVTAALDKQDDASHPAAILSDGSYAVFVKLGTDSFSLDQFQKELAGLRLLTELSGVLTPKPVGSFETAHGVMMILEAVSVIERGNEQWRQIGRALARIHDVKSERCGLDTDCYFGPLYQDNRPLLDWPSFYRERRLLPRFQLAVDSGHLPLEMVGPIEAVISRLPELCGPAVAPCLLHGDAHANNCLSSAEGAVLIDPSVHFGHPELDLAHLEFWSPVPNDVFDGYRELSPIDSGFFERLELWRIASWLGVIAVTGADYVDRLRSAVAKYV